MIDFAVEDDSSANDIAERWGGGGAEWGTVRTGVTPGRRAVYESRDSWLSCANGRVSAAASRPAGEGEGEGAEGAGG